MADNVTVNSNTTTGATIAADDIGGIHYPRSKISIGADGSAADCAATNPLPVGGNTVKTGSGTVYAFLLDSDGHLQVDVLSAASTAVTNAGTFAVQAAQSGTWNIATVTTVTTVSTVTAVSDAQVQGKAAHDAVVSGNPVLLGAYASATAPTAVSADGDAVRLWADLAGRLQIGDGAGSLTVDAPVGTPVFVRLSDGTSAISTLPVSLASLPTLAAGTNNIGDVDVLSVVPGTGATSLGKAVDSAIGSTDTGVAPLFVRDDALGTLTMAADGDYVQGRVDSIGALWVTVSGSVQVSSVDSGTVSATQSGTWTVTLAAGTNTNEVVGDAAHDAVAAGNPLLMGAYASAAAPSNVSADADAVRLWALRNGAQVVNLSAAGALLPGDATDGLLVNLGSNNDVTVTGTVTVGSHAVTNAGTFAVQVDGTALTRLTDIETNTDSCAVVGNGAAATAQRVTLANDSTGVIATVTTVTTVSTVTTLTGSSIAHDAADSGNPHKIGAKATASVLGETVVAANDRTDLRAGTDGVLIVREGSSLEDIISERVTNTDGASTAMTGAFAATASQRIYLTDITICNSSATFCTVDIRDGAAGAVLWTFPIPATGGVTHRFSRPIRFSANTALAYDASAATSTLTISVSGYKSKA